MFLHSRCQTGQQNQTNQSYDTYDRSAAASCNHGNYTPYDTNAALRGTNSQQQSGAGPGVIFSQYGETSSSVAAAAAAAAGAYFSVDNNNMEGGRKRKSMDVEVHNNGSDLKRPAVETAAEIHDFQFDMGDHGFNRS